MRTSVRVSLFLSALFCLSLLSGSVFAGEAILEKGIAEYRAENFEEAAASLGKAVEQHPESATARYYLGLTFKKLGQYHEAAVQLRQSLSLTPPVLDAYPELIDALYATDDIRGAGEWLDRADKEGVKSPLLTFYRGLVLYKEKRYADALAAFRLAKQQDSSLSQQADLRIAMVHAQEHRAAEARESLKAVIAVDPSSDLASFASEYERSLAKAKEPAKRWQMAVNVAYQYDDNVILKPTLAIPGIDVTGDRDSSVLATVKLDYAAPANGPWFFNGQLFVYSNTYFDTTSHSMIAPTLTLMPGYNFKSSALTLPVAASYVWLKDKGYMDIVSLRPTYSFLMAPGHIGRVSAGFARRNMIQAALAPEEDRDASIYLASVSYVHPFSDNRGVLNINYEYSQENTRGDNWKNNGNMLAADILFPATQRLSVSLGAQAFFQDYRNVHTVFGVKRKDKTYTGSALVAYELRRALSLKLQFTHTTADSNVPLYDYRRNVYTAGLEYLF